MESYIAKRIEEYLSSLKEIDLNDYNALKNIKDEDLLSDMFYKDLSFGTGGLRGIMDLGNNRMNYYNVFKASKGFAAYLKKNFSLPSIVIGYDSRNNSQNFAFKAALTFAALNVKVYLFKNLIPTPTVSFAIRKLKTSGGIIITASHNPKEYNGYKVYNDTGCQITLKEANEIEEEINKIDPFKDYIKGIDLSEELKKGNIEFIDDSLVDDFILSNLKTSILNDFNQKDIKIVYTPLNGTGLIPVTKTLKKAGFNHILIPKEQKYPDGNFTTCPKPNPELKEALSLGINLAKKENSDLLIATDPDADRCGVGIKYKDDFILLSGNEVSTLLLNWFIEVKGRENLKNKIVIRSIVSTSIVDEIVKENNLKLIKVLTGFKFIGEQMNLLEKNNKIDDYLFGFEESYGYLTNKEVRDKDSINASLLIAEMFYYYHKNNINLYDKLMEIYKKYGFYKNKLLSKDFKGEDGFKKMNQIIENIRSSSITTLNNLFNKEINDIEDFKLQVRRNEKEKIIVKELPTSNVIKINFKDNSSFILRPSGTEPKLKCYIEVKENGLIEANKKIEEMEVIFEKITK